jgi:methionyl aminopeptidase
MGIKIHTEEEFIKMRKAGFLAATLLLEIRDYLKPGISSLDVDIFARKFIEKNKVQSACLGYKGSGDVPFPGAVCISQNHIVCHGVPSDYVFKSGDIVSVDVTLIVDGYHGDTCHTFEVGNVNPILKNFVRTAKAARDIGIQAVKDGAFLSDIGAAIQEFIGKKHSIVREFCGHGIGTVFHAEPQVEHVGVYGEGPQLKAGMFFTVEPMINMGKRHIRVLNDSWTVITKDFQPSAQFEHTIGIKKDGVEIFTYHKDLA